MSPPPKPPIWLDNNILVNIDNGKMPHAEAEIIALQRDGHEMLLPASVRTEFLYGQGFRPVDTARRAALLARLRLWVDPVANQVPMSLLRAWRDEAIHHGLSIPDADIIAQIRASARLRGIRNPIFLTKDGGGTLITMRQRGVLALEFKANAIRPHIPMSTPKPVPKPVARFFRAGLSAAKAGIVAGLKAAFSAENIAAAIPEMILAIADRVAAQEAIRKIDTKFLKEGFAKGVAAGAMGWTEEEVALNLLNRVTPFRVKGLEDPAGLLTIDNILQLAEAYENYAVGIGYQFSSSKTSEWKNDMRAKGFPVLKKYGYDFGRDPEVLFEYDFIDKLAWVLRPTTDSILEPAIRYKVTLPGGAVVNVRP